MLRASSAPRSDRPGVAGKHDLSLHWSSLFGYAQETMFPDLDGFAQANAVSAPLTYTRDDEGDEPDQPLDFRRGPGLTRSPR